MTDRAQYGSSDPSATAGGYPSGGGAESQAEEASKAEVAKDQASDVAGGAAQAAQHVVGVAKEQAGQVTAEAGRQVQSLLGQAQSQLSEQARAQQQRAADGLKSVADQLASMAEKSTGMAGDLTQQASAKLRQAAGWVESRDVAGILGDLRSFARRRPSAFLTAALGAGMTAGRFARGLSADAGNPATKQTPVRPEQTGSAGGGVRPPVGAGKQAKLTDDIRAIPAADDLYGTGLVPDWTGKSAAELSADR